MHVFMCAWVCTSIRAYYVCVCVCKHASVRVLYGYIVDPSFSAWE